MADTNTTTYNLVKPEVDGAEGTWGTSINGNLDSIDSLLSGSTQLTNLNLSGNITIAGTVDGVDISALNTTVSGKAPIASPTFTGTVGGITSTMVGLGNVDNTSDANKPVSTATQTALNAKADDNAVVKLTGDQTITGNKTFNSDSLLMPDDSQMQLGDNQEGTIGHLSTQNLDNGSTAVTDALNLTDTNITINSTTNTFLTNGANKDVKLKIKSTGADVTGTLDATGTVTAPTFVGNVTGNVTGNASGSSGSCTGNSATATLASTVTVTEESSSGASHPVVFHDDNNALFDDRLVLHYTPSTTQLFSQNLLGGAVESVTTTHNRGGRNAGLSIADSSSSTASTTRSKVYGRVNTTNAPAGGGAQFSAIRLPDHQGQTGSSTLLGGFLYGDNLSSGTTLTTTQFASFRGGMIVQYGASGCTADLPIAQFSDNSGAETSKVRIGDTFRITSVLGTFTLDCDGSGTGQTVYKLGNTTNGTASTSTLTTEVTFPAGSYGTLVAVYTNIYILIDHCGTGGS
tara:strand:- start:5361 stop:6911 length:1551 start_codon:yes stop_codon:yes gene_type:complete